MIRIAITVEAFGAIARTLTFRQHELREQDRRAWATSDLAGSRGGRPGCALRAAPGEGYSDMILRLAKETTPTDADEGEAIMAYPQSTLEEFVESERSMFLDGEPRYGRFLQARAGGNDVLELVRRQDRPRPLGYFRSVLLADEKASSMLSPFSRRCACIRFRRCSICVMFLKLALGLPTPSQIPTFGVSAGHRCIWDHGPV